MLMALVIMSLPRMLDSLSLSLPAHWPIDSRISADAVHVKNIYEMENGDIYVSLTSDKKFSTVSIPGITNPEQNETDEWTTGYREFTFVHSLINKLGGR